MSSTAFATWDLKAMRPSVMRITTVCAFIRAPVLTTLFALCIAWAMFVMPLCHSRASIDSLSFAMSVVRADTMMASDITLSLSNIPLPNSTAPAWTASWPYACGLRRSTNLPAKVLIAAKPSSPSDPLPSIASTMSSSPTQVSSPTHGSVLHGILSSRAASSSLGHTPLPIAGTATSRVRRRNPELHAMSQGDQPDHSPSVQSLSQAPVLHTCVSWRVLHAWPSYLGFCSNCRTRDCTPPPQSEVHFDHADHSDTLQSMGHLFRLHGCVTRSAGQGAPYSLFLVMTSRVMFISPPTRSSSQLFEQLDAKKSVR
mmetsp:Transcript_95713/g.249329  ORF Transcript_95713/g.249329 Transcript_95713/m.249329 type:complete len:313 (-) Transcript_95713:1351-2289(-)